LKRVAVGQPMMSIQEIISDLDARLARLRADSDRHRDHRHIRSRQFCAEEFWTGIMKQLIDRVSLGVDGWFRRLISGRPHFIVGTDEDPYLYRWYLLPRNRRLNIYLHKFLRDDEDSALHDHPWWFVSLVIRGRYTEIVEGGQIERSAPSLAYRPAEHRHRVVLDGVAKWNRIPCWTIVITGRSKRTWGFWCPKGFVPWHQFVETNAEGNDTARRGCGEFS
jgi:hypothetical protein